MEMGNGDDKIQTGVDKIRGESECMKGEEEEEEEEKRRLSCLCRSDVADHPDTADLRYDFCFFLS